MEKNEVQLWVFPSESDPDDWNVALESEEHEIVLRRFFSDYDSPHSRYDTAISYANSVGRVLGIVPVVTEPRGM